MQFYQVEIGSKFHTGKSFGAGATKDVEKFQVWEKVSKTQAKCVSMTGYGNTRFVGKIDNFSVGQKVYAV